MPVKQCNSREVLALVEISASACRRAAWVYITLQPEDCPCLCAGTGVVDWLTSGLIEQVAAFIDMMLPDSRDTVIAIRKGRSRMEVQHTNWNRVALAVQEQESLVKELTEVLQRQKTRVASLQKDRAELSAQLAAYQPAEHDKLRAEMNTLRERVGELAGIKVGLVYMPECKGFPTFPPWFRMDFCNAVQGVLMLVWASALSRPACRHT